MAAQIVEKALEEIETNITLLELGVNLLNSLLVFVVVFLLATIFNFSVYFALVPAAVFFFYSIARIFYKNKYLVVEQKVPEMNEKLRTVADNVYRVNPIVDSLKEEVVQDMGKIKTSEFIDYSDVIIKLLALTLVSIIVVIVSFLNVNFDFEFRDIPIFGAPDILEVRESGQDIVDLNLTYLEGNLSDILGNRSLARLGTEELQLTINPLESDADISKVRKTTEEDFNAPLFPKEIYTSYDVAYNERIAKENQEIVKNYFEQIAR